MIQNFSEIGSRQVPDYVTSILEIDLDHIAHNYRFLQSIHKAGENSARWRGGREPYYGKNWRRQQRRARKRDGYTCQKCGKSEQDNGRALDMHHIIPFCEFDYVVGENDNYKQANKLTNLISLCMSCHQRVERGNISVQLPLSISSA